MVKSLTSLRKRERRHEFKKIKDKKDDNYRNKGKF